MFLEGVATVPGALRGRNFRLLFLAQTVSVVGDAIAPVALAFAVLDLTGSASDLGLAIAARTVALIVFVLVGGVWADRLPQRVLMIWSDVVRLASQGALAALLVTGSATMWQIVLLQAVSGGASAFFRPACSAVIPATVEGPQLQEANALLNVSSSGAWMLGPLAAGALVATLGASAAIAVDAATFGVSALLLLGLRLERVQRTTRESFLRELRDGWSAVRSRSWVWASLSAFAVFNVVWGPFWVLGPLLARRDLGGASAWATIVAGVGLGSVAGSLLATRFRPRRPLVAAHAAVVAAAPVFCALALDAPAGVIAALAIPMGLGLALGNTLWETTLQERIPRASLSRVSAYDWLASMAFAPIGMTIAGPIADAVGIGTTLVAAAVLVAAIEAVALAVPGIRAIRRTTDATAESAERQPQPQAA